jgi:hypothetical protein
MSNNPPQKYYVNIWRMSSYFMPHFKKYSRWYCHDQERSIFGLSESRYVHHMIFASFFPPIGPRATRRPRRARKKVVSSIKDIPPPYPVNALSILLLFSQMLVPTRMVYFQRILSKRYGLPYSFTADVFVDSFQP